MKKENRDFWIEFASGWTVTIIAFFLMIWAVNLMGSHVYGVEDLFEKLVDYIFTKGL